MDYPCQVKRGGEMRKVNVDLVIAASPPIRRFFVQIGVSNWELNCLARAKANALTTLVVRTYDQVALHTMVLYTE